MENAPTVSRASALPALSFVLPQLLFAVPTRISLVGGLFHGCVPFGQWSFRMKIKKPSELLPLFPAICLLSCAHDPWLHNNPVLHRYFDSKKQMWRSALPLNSPNQKQPVKGLFFFHSIHWPPGITHFPLGFSKTGFHCFSKKKKAPRSSDKRQQKTFSSVGGIKWNRCGFTVCVSESGGFSWCVFLASAKKIWNSNRSGEMWRGQGQGGRKWRRRG